MLKKEIRMVGIDDAPFNKFKKGRVLVVGAVFRGGLMLDGIMSTKVTIDGKDSTAKIIRMISKSKFKEQLRCIFLDGIALCGFNVVDIIMLNRKTNIPVVVVIRKMPDIEKIKKTLERINKKEKIELLEKGGNIYNIGKIYVQIAGISLEKVKEFLKIACTRSLIPEPVRIAHLIASGIVKGESKGKA